jgi:hypothetical protein
MNKKTLLFFSRSELTHLYGMVSKYLEKDFNIVHVAYSDIEANILEKKYAIKTDFIFKSEICNCTISSDNYSQLISEIDNLFMCQTSGRFNLNSSIQSDRTFNNLSYFDSIHITACYYLIWSKIFKVRKIDFFIHEPTSLMINHIASVLCKSLNIFYSTHILVPGENEFNFLMLEFDDGCPTELIQNYNKIKSSDLQADGHRIDNFLTQFRSSYKVFYNIQKHSGLKFLKYFKLCFWTIYDEIMRLAYINCLNPRIDNIEIFLYNNRLNKNRLGNLISYATLKYDELDIEDVYYFYPLHLEPEAVVLYWSDGIYKNQIKLIENIAAQLPPNVYLYVKDHPHLLGYRVKEDYVKLKGIPNVKLLNPNLAGKEVIKYSKGVITLNGTAGFEGILLNKQVIVFGNSFYRVSERVNYVSDIRSFRELIYDLINTEYHDDDELKKFVLAYLRSTKKGFTNFFSGAANKLPIDLELNCKQIARQLSQYFNSLNAS